jgi:hypothetical protein
MNRADYIQLFSDLAAEPSERQREALKQALDVRKFEIDTYWKRATYFWTLIAVTFGGYFALGGQPNPDGSFLVGCLGLLFSAGWYLVNRGSSSWQRNWEGHVDLLEDEVMGPLHKTLINRKAQPFADFAGPYPYSPSRVNIILSICVTAAWLVLIARSVSTMTNTLQSWWLGSLIGALTAFGVFSLFCWGRSTSRKGTARTFEARTRQYG